MFTPFQKTLLTLVTVGFLALGVVVWANGAAQPAPVTKTADRHASNTASANEPPQGIVAIGEAAVQGVPDTGYLAFAVQASGAIGSDIAVQLQTRVDRLLAKASEFGVTEDDIVLGPIQFQPQFAYDAGKGSPALNSFSAYQQIAIECDEIAGMPLLIQALMKDGAVSALSVRYAPSAKGPAYLVARERAIADAREKAALTATAAGLRLGAAMSVSDYQPAPSPYGPYGPSTGRFPRVGGPGFPPAEIDTVIRVQVQFAIEPAN